MDWIRQIELYEKILLLPDKENQWNKNFAAKFRIRTINMQSLILTIDETLPGEKLRVIPVLEMQQILKTYQLYEFTDKLIIGSMTFPFGRKWDNLINSRCMTKEQIMDAMLDF